MNTLDFYDILNNLNELGHMEEEEAVVHQLRQQQKIAEALKDGGSLTPEAAEALTGVAEVIIRDVNDACCADW